MTDRKICMEDGTPLSEELIHIEKPEFELVQREQEIRDVEFKTEAVSYGKDVFRRFLRSKTTVVAACITLFIILMGIVGPYISPYNYLEQNVELKNMPPRIQGLEKLGIFDGSEVIEVKKDNLSEYEDCIIKNLGTVTDKSAFGTVEMERIKINMYKYKGADDVYYWFGSDNLGRDLFSRLWQGTRVSLILAFAVVAINLTVGLIVGAICGYYGGSDYPEAHGCYLEYSIPAAYDSSDYAVWFWDSAVDACVLSDRMDGNGKWSANAVLPV